MCSLAAWCRFIDLSVAARDFNILSSHAHAHRHMMQKSIIQLRSFFFLTFSQGYSCIFIIHFGNISRPFRCVHIRKFSDFNYSFIFILIITIFFTFVSLLRFHLFTFVIFFFVLFIFLSLTLLFHSLIVFQSFFLSALYIYTSRSLFPFPLTT